MTPLEAAYLSLKDRTGASFEEFKAACRDCEVHPIYAYGRIGGAVIVKGPEIHACILPFAQRRWLNKASIQIMNDVIAVHGFAQTHVTTDAGRIFVERLGFTQSGDVYKRTTPWAWKHYSQ